MAAFGLGASNVGAVPTGVTAKEYGDGRNHTTVLTIAMTDAVTVADNAALADGALIYTFPAGDVVVNGATFNVAVNHDSGASAAGAGEMALGSTQSSGANATIGASASTDESFAGPLASVDTADDGVFTAGAASGNHVAVLAAGAHTVYLNIADTWADVTGTALDSDLAGTVTINWTLCA